MQAGITVDWTKESEGDKIAILSRRVYEYTNHVLGLGIEEHGQEDLMSIQYFGRGENDTAPDRYGKKLTMRDLCSNDMRSRLPWRCFPPHTLTLFLFVSFSFSSRYTPHCDGDCTGLPHKNGTRMATMVMYW
jgi:hypothetical protein